MASKTIEIALTQGKVALIDECDEALVSSYKWRASSNHGTFRAITNVRDPETGEPTTLKMHALIHAAADPLAYINSPEIDHVNGNPLDNRRVNLRPATRVQNSRNRAAMRSNRSGHKGVYLNKVSDRWRARISLNGRQTHLGYFDTPEEAARTYDTAARDLHGSFARLNFPGSV